MGTSRCCVFVLAMAAVALPAGSWGAEDPPAIVALTLDTSGSIRAELIEQTRSLAVSILEALPQGSEVALFVFDDSSRLILERTHEPEAVRQALAGVRRAGRYTALYDAIYDASRYLEAAPRSRKAIVLVTDGKDENSALRQEDGLKVATAARIPIFAVGVGRMEEADLSRISKLTGGEFTPMGQVDAERIAARISALEPSGAATAPVPPAAAAPSPNAPTSVRGVPWNLLVLIGALFVASAVAVVILVVRLRPAAGSAAVRETPPPPVLSSDETASASVADVGLLLDTVSATVVLRATPQLRVTTGPAPGRVVALSPNRGVSIGRAPTNDLEVADPSVSSEHCRVEPEGDGFVVCDTGSTNGTLVNGAPVERQRLREGDVISIGRVKITFGRG